MKKNHILLLSIILLSAACKKSDNNVITADAAVNVINAAVDAGTVKINPGAASNFYWSKASDQVAYGANKYSITLAGSRNIVIVSATDTTKTLFSGTINLQQSINTLYLAGQSPNIDTIFRAEPNIPVINSQIRVPDSSMYVRFVNLSPNSVPLKINIQGSSATPEVSSLPYKGIGDFKKYPAKTTTANYVFEIRNASTDVILFTYTLAANGNRYRTLALVVKGLMGTGSGTNALGIFPAIYQ